MNELISGQKLIEEVERLRTAYNFSACAVIGKENCEGSCADCILDSLEEFINSQPPADQWIPCSERLPEERQKVLVTLETFTGVRFVRMDWIKDGNWWLWNSDNVTAWMPLPEPYKGVE